MKHKKIWLLAAVVLAVLLSAADNKTSHEVQVRAYLQEGLDTLSARLSLFSDGARSAPDTTLQEQFVHCRLAYKKVEAFVEYYYPATAARINGAPLPEAEASEPEEPMNPTGFQVLEPLLYDPLTTQTRLIIRNEISSISGQVRRVQQYAATQSITDAGVFDLLRLNALRLIAKGISGFDCPVALSSIPEAAETVQGMADVLRCYGPPPAFTQKAAAALAYLRRPGVSFNQFDRAAFLTQYLNPLLEELHRWQVAAGIPFNNSPRALRADAATPFSESAFSATYFAPSGIRSNIAMTALGKRLFYDPLVSGSGGRSCGSCHQAALAFTDGEKTAEVLGGGGHLRRNTPTLLNAALQPVQFADSRAAFLEDQVHDVISNDDEMGGDFNAILKKLRAQKEYKTLFAAAYPEEERHWTHTAVRMALAAYVRSLVALNAPFDRYMRGDAKAMTAQQVEGFNLFMGKGKCGTCHYAPLFSGAVPPLYDKMESEVLGVPAAADTIAAALDADEGKYALYHMPHQRYAFKTPGLRNAALTAPYMHNGVFKDLESVLDFYNRGGGAGIGAVAENQTLAPDPLQLTAQEQRDIIAFIGTLTDTSSLR